ncbi:hypothetical protein B0T10DRAFT_588189 [Thelonectria olida]|uniref:BZIP domain-containing protein n=1 Tax=Thelonectria olida TaxID=1576542 RepID=A0A9P9AJF8_9HYPO|nr:hypothetical protein B0T10DRAFT_588189 [Thelonectria olida]
MVKLTLGSAIFLQTDAALILNGFPLLGTHNTSHKMQPATKKRGESLKARRERNRQAQHDFRRRRQAAEEAQRRRIQHLEKTIEELSNVIVGLCDEMLSTKDIARQPSLMALLQRSTTRALTLATSVSNTSETDTVRESVDDGDKRRDDEQNKEMHRGNKNPPERKAADSTLSQPSPCQHPSLVVDAETDSFPTLRIDTDDLNNIAMGSSLNVLEPLVKQAWPQTHPNGLDTDSFPVRLVETTLSQACLFLNGEIYVPAEEMERAFGSTLRLLTRPQLVAYMQWLLGPGRNDMYQATGINWNSGSARGVKSYFQYFLPSLAHAQYDSSDTDSPPDHASNQAGQPEFLTALGVQEQLQKLGAKVLGPDTIELSIRTSGSSEWDRANSDSHPGALPMAHTLESAAPATLTVRLDTFLLATNLAYVAKCLDKGPVYPRHGIARAVEASIILARGG